MKNLTSRNFVVCITFFALLALLLASCSSSHGLNYQNHLKSKKTGHTHMTTTNKGCNWANN